MKGVAYVAFVAAGVALSAQSPPASQPPRPTFKTGVNAVVVDVRVVDRDGRFIPDLTVDDFQVFEDGKEQRISTFDLIDLPSAPSPVASESIVTAGPPSDVASNTENIDGRLYVIVLDDIFGNAPQVSTRMGIDAIPPPALDGPTLARELIFHMADGDRAAVVTTSGRRDMAQEFTSDRARLLATVDRFVANQGQDPDFPAEASGYARSSMGPNPFMGDSATVHDAMVTLKEVASWLGAIEGRRKAIVLVSQRLISISANFAITNWSRKAGLQNLETPADMRDLIEATSRANVTIYTLSPMLALTRDADPPVADEYADALVESRRTGSVVSIAQATGGFSRAFNYNGVFERIASENGSYYLLGFVSTLTKEDGNFHRIDVRTTRGDLGVRSRVGYVARPKPSLREALQSPASVRGLPVSMAAVPYRGSDFKSFVSIVVDLEDAKPDAHYEVAIAAAPINGKAADVRRVTVNGGTVTSRLDLKPGRYHVRTAALDMVGDRRGSVLFDLDVPDFSQSPLTMSGIVLGTARGARPNTVGRDQGWRDRLGIPPTTRREFDADEELSGYVELYDNAGGPSSAIEVVTTIRSEDGAVQFSDTQRSTSVRHEKTLPPHQVRFKIPLADVVPGRSVLTIEARPVGDSRVVVRREIPVSIR